MTTFDTLLEGALVLGGDDDHDDGGSGLRSFLEDDDVNLGLQSMIDGIPVLGAVFADTSYTAFEVDATRSAFAYDVEVVDGDGDTSADILEIFTTITQRALAEWSRFLGAAEGASLEVQVTVTADEDAVASAGAGGIFFDRALDTNGSGVFDTGDFVLAIAGSLLEMQTGIDPNGAAADIVVNVNSNLIDSGAFFFDTTGEEAIPAGQFDFFSVILHELGHGLGFFGLANAPGPNQLPVLDFGEAGAPIFAEVGMLYDFLTETVNGRPFFTGENVVSVYGEAAPVEYVTGNPGSDISHWQAVTNPNGEATDLRLALMNPFVIPGDRVEIGDMELALMADIGHTITQGSGQLLNTLDTLPDEAVPNVFLASDIAIEDGLVGLTVALDAIPPFLSIASGVAVEVVNADGLGFTDRVLFQPGETTGQVVFDLGSFIAGGFADRRGTAVSETFEVTLYNASQAQFASGDRFETYTVEIEGLFGSAGNDYLRGTNGDDSQFGGAGSDRLVGGNGDDALFGGSGRDRIYAGNGDDRAEGGDGDDRIDGGNGADTILGGDGRDVISAGNEDDIVLGGAGNDRIRLGNGDDASDGGDGDDDIAGGNGNDLVIGGAGDDTVSGGNGNDTLVADLGEDLLLGGSGADLFDVSAAEEATVRDLDFGEGDAIFFGDSVITDAAGLSAFLESDGVSAENIGGDLQITFGTGQTVVLDDFATVDVA